MLQVLLVEVVLLLPLQVQHHLVALALGGRQRLQELVLGCKLPTLHYFNVGRELQHQNPDQALNQLLLRVR